MSTKELLEQHAADTNEIAQLLIENHRLHVQAALLLRAIRDYNAAWLNERKPGITARKERERMQATHIVRQKLFDAGDIKPSEAGQYIERLEEAATKVLEQHQGNPDDYFYPVPSQYIHALALALKPKQDTTP